MCGRRSGPGSIPPLEPSAAGRICELSRHEMEQRPCSDGVSSIFRSFPDRLVGEADRLRAEADKLPQTSQERDFILQKAGQLDATVKLDAWLSSPGLRPPK